MLEQRAKILTLIFLMLVLLTTCLSFDTENVGPSATKSPNNFEKVPVRMVDITIAQYRHDQLFEQLSKFADKFGLAIRIAQTDPAGENFLVEMWSDDIEIIGLDSGDPGLFEIWFYTKDEEHPVPLSFIDELIVELRALIAEIPNTTLTVEE